MTDRRPTLAALLDGPESVPFEAIPDAIGELEKAKAILYARLTERPAPAAAPTTGKWLTPKEVEARYPIKEGYIYHKWKSLPWVTKGAGTLLACDEAGLVRWLKSRRR